METIILILQLVIPNTYCTKIDFDGCCTITIAAEHQKYQKFLIRMFCFNSFVSLMDIDIDQENS